MTQTDDTQRIRPTHLMLASRRRETTEDPVRELLTAANTLIHQSARSAVSAVQRRRKGVRLNPDDIAQDAVAELLSMARATGADVGDVFGAISIGQAAARCADRAAYYAQTTIPAGTGAETVGETEQTSRETSDVTAGLSADPTAAIREASAGILPKTYLPKATRGRVDVYGVSQASRDGMRSALDVLLHNLTDGMRRAAMADDWQPSRASDAAAWDALMTQDTIGWPHAMDDAVNDENVWPRLGTGPMILRYVDAYGRLVDRPTILPTAIPCTLTAGNLRRDGGGITAGTLGAVHADGGRLRYASDAALARAYDQSAWRQTTSVLPVYVPAGMPNALDACDQLAAGYFPLSLYRYATGKGDARKRAGDVQDWRHLRPSDCLTGESAAMRTALGQAYRDWRTHVDAMLTGTARTVPCAHERARRELRSTASAWIGSIMMVTADCACETRTGSLFDRMADSQRARYRRENVLRRDARVGPFGPYHWATQTYDATAHAQDWRDWARWYAEHYGATTRPITSSDGADGPKWQRVMASLTMGDRWTSYPSTSYGAALVLSNEGTAVSLCVPHDGGGAVYADGLAWNGTGITRTTAGVCIARTYYRGDPIDGVVVADHVGQLAEGSFLYRPYAQTSGPAYVADKRDRITGYVTPSDRCTLAIAETQVREIGRRVLRAFGVVAGIRYRTID